MEPRIRYATTADGVSIAFWTLGKGEPLVYMAGGPWGHVELWDIPECRRWYERLAQERMLVRYDVRATGWSERAVSDHSLEAQVLDVGAVVDRLEMDRFVMFGAFDAGPAAVAYAVRYPERVSRLVLWCSWARSSDIRSPRIRAWLGLIDQDWDLMTDTCAHLALGWPAGEVGRHAAQRLRESVTPEAARAALEAMGTFDVTELLPSLEVPTLVLHRSDIPWLPVSIARELASRIPDARLSILEGESTAPYLGDTEATASAIDEFLGEGTQERTQQREADAPASKQDGSGPTRGYPHGLTAREVEVLRHLAGGRTNDEIAEELFVSVRTVERHVANIYAKIGARGRANATAGRPAGGPRSGGVRGDPALRAEAARRADSLRRVVGGELPRAFGGDHGARDRGLAAATSSPPRLRLVPYRRHLPARVVRRRPARADGRADHRLVRADAPAPHTGGDHPWNLGLVRRARHTQRCVRARGGLPVHLDSARGQPTPGRRVPLERGGADVAVSRLERGRHTGRRVAGAVGRPVLLPRARFRQRSDVHRGPGSGHRSADAGPSRPPSRLASAGGGVGGRTRPVRRRA